MRPQLFSTRITDLFGIPHPIICGGLMWLAAAPYVAGVVNAGGMAFITAVTYPDPVRFREEIQRCRAMTGGKPFGVNLSLSRHRDTLGAFAPHLEILCEEGVKFVETSGASPEPIIPRLRAAGVKIMHKVPAIRYALTADRMDIDAIALVGAEAGGHPGVYMVGSMVQAALAPSQIKHPLVIAGGIGNGSQLAAVLAMGAEGVMLGSRLLATAEVTAHEDYKRRIIAGDGTESAVVMRIFRNNHRVLANESTEAVTALEAQGVVDFEPYRGHVDGQLVKRAYESGDLARGMIDYGQSVAFIDGPETIEQAFDRLIDEAADAATRLGGLRCA